MLFIVAFLRRDSLGAGGDFVCAAVDAGADACVRERGPAFAVSIAVAVC